MTSAQRGVRGCGRRGNCAVPAISILLALLVGAVMMVLSSPPINGFDPLLPFTAYGALSRARSAPGRGSWALS